MTTGEAAGAGAMPVQRIAWIDAVKGIAIGLVVFGHCSRGLASAGLLPPDSVLHAVDYVIYCFHVPLFFFLSGVFGAQVLPFFDRRFWLGRLRSIVWPYVFWMTVELLVLSLAAGRTNMGQVAFAPATYLYAPISPFWFLYALACCALFVHSALRFRPALLLCIPLFMAGQLAPDGIISLTSWGLLYYVLGIACSRAVRGPGFDRATASWLVLAASAATGLALCLAFRSAGVNSQQAVPAAVVGGLFVICFTRRMQVLAGSTAFAWTSYLGQISLTILVVHVLGTAGTRIVLLSFGVKMQVVHLALGTFMGLAGPVMLQVVCTRLGIAGLLGLSRVPNAAAPGQRVRQSGISPA